MLKALGHLNADTRDLNLFPFTLRDEYVCIIFRIV